MTRQRACAIVLGLIVLGGCRDITPDLGRPPLIRLTDVQERVSLPAGETVGRTAAEALRQAIRRLGTPVGIDVVILAGDAQAAQVRALLLGQGIDPDRILQDAAETEAPAVLLSRTIAMTRSCDLAVAPSADPSLSLDSLGRCIQQQNLVDMLADPRDLIQPPTTEGAPGTQAIKAIDDLDGAGHGQGGDAGTATSSSHP